MCGIAEINKIQLSIGETTAVRCIGEIREQIIWRRQVKARPGSNAFPADNAARPLPFGLTSHA
jgi:hypothetical protein